MPRSAYSLIRSATSSCDSDQRGAGAAADQADARPQVGRDLQARRSRAARCRSRIRFWPTDSLWASPVCTALDLARGDAVEQPIGLGPGLLGWCPGR